MSNKLTAKSKQKYHELNAVNLKNTIVDTDNKDELTDNNSELALYYQKLGENINDLLRTNTILTERMSTFSKTAQDYKELIRQLKSKIQLLESENETLLLNLKIKDQEIIRKSEENNQLRKYVYQLQYNNYTQPPS